MKILAPIDFSPGSKDVLRVAVRIANDRNAELVIAHAWYIPALATPSEPSQFAPELVLKLADDAKRYLDDAVRDAIAQGGKRVTGKLLNGVPWVCLTSELDGDTDYELVVMGTHGRTGLKRFLLGSVAEAIVRHAPCSVLVVRAGESGPFANVLCPVDFSSGSEAAAQHAHDLVRRGGKLVFLHVIEAPVAYSGEHFPADFLRDLDRYAAQALAGLAKKFSDVEVETHSRIGSAGSQILAMIDEHPFDLVVMGSHGRTGIRRMLLGSVAEKVVRHARCPVLISRTRHA